MKESNIQTIWGKHIKEYPPLTNTAYELKLCKEKSLPFDSVKDHQIAGLMQAKSILFHKISDQPIFGKMKTRFNLPKPFDCLVLVRAEAYVVVLFYKPRQKKKFILIEVSKWVDEALTSDRKSLTEERAMLIGTIIQI